MTSTEEGDDPEDEQWTHPAPRKETTQMTTQETTQRTRGKHAVQIGKPRLIEMRRTEPENVDQTGHLEWKMEPEMGFGE